MLPVNKFMSGIVAKLLRSSPTAVLLTAFAIATLAQAEEPVQTIVIPPLEPSAQQHMRYFPQLLRLALETTRDTDGAYELHEYPKHFTSGRYFQLLRRDAGIDVHWGPARSESEGESGLIRVPMSLLRGLNSYRVLLIREEDQSTYSAIGKLEQLKRLRGGMVAHWPDTQILLDHNFNLVTPAHYPLLFTMLEAGRLDYLPRGLYEAWAEQEVNADKGIVVEKELMLYYPGQMYFFVNENDAALANRIERGLREALADGSFEELFFSIPAFERGYREIIKTNRRTFYLQAPDTN